jgi:hypothetical protein
VTAANGFVEPVKWWAETSAVYVLRERREFSSLVAGIKSGSMPVLEIFSLLPISQHVEPRAGNNAIRYWSFGSPI